LLLRHAGLFERGTDLGSVRELLSDGMTHGAGLASRGGIAYTLVDVDSPIAEEVVKSIYAIDGVLSVRMIAVPSEV
jgi:hypothetical protein